MTADCGRGESSDYRSHATEFRTAGFTSPSDGFFHTATSPPSCWPEVQR